MTYLVLTFGSTHKALKAEKLLETFAIDMIPTPRQLSADCGISIKGQIEDLDQMIEILKNAQVEHECYEVTKENKSYHFKKH